MLLRKEDFCLHVSSEMHPQQDVFETISPVIPAGRLLHLMSFQAVCAPMRAEDGESNCLKVELFWTDVLEGETICHPVDLVYTECTFFKAYPGGLESCLDGVKLVGNGVARLGIRRQVEGCVGPQYTHVAVRGHIH